MSQGLNAREQAGHAHFTKLTLIHVTQRVLVLDDDPKTVDTVALLVATLGYTAVRCCDANAAIHRMETEYFDLFLSDYDMPQLNGVEVIELLRKKDIQIPALLMSGHVTTIDSQKAHQLKITHVLKKPFTVAELEKALKHTLSSTEKDPTRVILSQVDGYRFQSPYPRPSCTAPWAPKEKKDGTSAPCRLPGGGPGNIGKVI